MPYAKELFSSQSLISFWSSLRHLMVGAGLPSARQDNVTFMPSFPSVSELLSSSMILGGTAKCEMTQHELIQGPG